MKCFRLCVNNIQKVHFYFVILKKRCNFETEYYIFLFFVIIRIVSLYTMQIFKQFTFDAAHFLPNVPDGHKCKRMHGHTYQLKVFIEGELDPTFGWVIDFKELKEVIVPIIKEMDHHVLNEIPGLENPTCELITVWLWNKIKPQIPLLTQIELNETPTSGAVYRGK